jgi:hypothetical protein
VRTHTGSPLGRGGTARGAVSVGSRCWIEWRPAQPRRWRWKLERRRVRPRRCARMRVWRELGRTCRCYARLPVWRPLPLCRRTGIDFWPLYQELNIARGDGIVSQIDVERVVRELGDDLLDDYGRPDLRKLLPMLRDGRVAERLPQGYGIEELPPTGLATTSLPMPPKAAAENFMISDQMQEKLRQERAAGQQATQPHNTHTHAHTHTGTHVQTCFVACAGRAIAPVERRDCEWPSGSAHAAYASSLRRMLATVGGLDSSGAPCWGGASSGDEWGGRRQVGTASHVNRGRSFVWLRIRVSAWMPASECAQSSRCKPSLAAIPVSYGL